MSIRYHDDLPFAQTPARTLYLDLAQPDPLPDDPAPALIYMHPGGWQSGDKNRHISDFLTNAGYITASIQYRFSHEAQFPAQIHDAKAAVRWLRVNAAEYRIDPQRIGVWGHSAGGYLAAFLGTSAGIGVYDGDQNPGVSAAVQAVVNVAGVVWVLDGQPRLPGSPVGDLLGKSPTEDGDLGLQFSPITHIRNTEDTDNDERPPSFLMLHGTDDTVVDIKQSEYLHDRLIAAGVESTLIPIANGDHFLHTQWPIVEMLTLQFFDRALRSPHRTI